MRSTVFGILAALSFSASALAGRPVVAVFDIEDRGAKVSASLLENLVDLLETRLVSSGRYQVVPRSQLKEALLSQKRESYKECYQESCQIEVGKELAAEKTVATRVARIGKTCVVTVKVYDLRTSTAEAGRDARGACSEEGVYESLQKALETLLLGPGPKQVAKSSGVVPVSPQVKSPGLAEAEALEREGRLKEALRIYERLVRARPKDSPKALFRQGVVASKMGQSTMASKALGRFLGLYKRAPEHRAMVIEAYLEYGLVSKRSGNLRGAYKNYVRCLKMANHAGGAIATGKIAGRCAFELAEREYGGFERVKIRGGRRLTSDVQRKAQLFEKANSHYLLLIQKYKDPEIAVAALCMIGKGAEHFAQALLNSQPPKGLGAEQIAMYREALESQIIPIEEKGIEAYREAVKKSATFNLDTEWTRFAKERLRVLKVK